MYKVIINKDIVKEFKNIDDAMNYYGEHFKSARTIKLYENDKLVAKKDV